MTKGFLHHIEINVANLQETVQFWEGLLLQIGYREFQKWDRGRSWKLANTYIVFVQVEEKYAKMPYHRKHIGLNHIAFHAQSREQVDEMARKLKSQGVKMLYEERYPYAGGNGHYAVFFEDPNRIKVEVVSP